MAVINVKISNSLLHRVKKARWIHKFRIIMILNRFSHFQSVLFHLMFNADAIILTLLLILNLGHIAMW